MSYTPKEINGRERGIVGMKGKKERVEKKKGEGKNLSIGTWRECWEYGCSCQMVDVVHACGKDWMPILRY